MDNISSRRMPRFRRHRWLRLPMALKERDIEIIRIVARNRFIASDDIQVLLGDSGQTVLRRLQKLFHNSYVDRPRRQIERGNSRMIYGLGRRGAEILAGESERRITTDWSERNREAGLRYIEHSLMVSRLRTAIEHAARAKGLASVEKWVPDGGISSSVHVEIDGRIQRVPVRPDAFVTLKMLDAAGGRIFAFVECDRSTMSLARYELKLRAYWEFWRSGEAKRQLGMKNFLVLSVTTTEERCQNLVERCQRLPSTDLRMFLFAYERAYLPAASCRVFERFWESPNDRARHSITE